MQIRGLLCVLPVLLAVTAAAGESWQIVLIEGQDSGYVHTETREPATGPGSVETAIETLFRIKRMGGEVEIRSTVTTVEDAGGQIRRIGQKTAMGRNETVCDGVVEDGVLEFTTRTVGKPRSSSIDWPEDMPGPAEVERRLAALGARRGASVTYGQFEFTLGEPFQMTTTVVGPEQVTIGNETRELIHMVSAVDLAGMPDAHIWVDEHGVALRTATNMVGLNLTTEATDRSRVKSFLDGGAAAEMFLQSTITSNVRLPRPRSLECIVYRIAPKTPGKELPRLEDERQHVLDREEEGGLLLRVEALVPPAEARQKRPLADPPAELAEFLAPNAMLQSDAPLLLEMARAGVAGEADAWSAARKLERLVYETIRTKSLDVAFASALEVAENREGDCSEHAVLLAALCRSAGIPSRVAMGLVYVGGIFGGHAWTEVSIDGVWYALDGTIGRGVVDPTHLRFGTSSLQAGGFANGLLGVLQGLGNIDLEILSFTQDGVTTRVAGQVARFETRDGRFFDRVEGVSFDVPAGWTLTPGDPDILAMSNRFVLAELSRVAGPGSIRVVAQQVPPDFSLDELCGELAGGADQPDVVSRRVSGRDGIVFSYERNGTGHRVAAVLVGPTVYVVQASDVDEQTLQTFERLVGSLTIE